MSTFDEWKKNRGKTPAEARAETEAKAKAAQQGARISETVKPNEAFEAWKKQRAEIVQYSAPNEMAWKTTDISRRNQERDSGLVLPEIPAAQPVTPAVARPAVQPAQDVNTMARNTTDISLRNKQRDAQAAAYQEQRNARNAQTDEEKEAAGQRAIAAEESAYQLGKKIEANREASGGSVYEPPKPGKKILNRFVNTNVGGLLGSVASTSEAARTLYEAGQGGRTQRDTEMLSDVGKQLETAKQQLEAAREQNRKAPGSWDETSFQNTVDALQRQYDALYNVVNENVQQRAVAAVSDMNDSVQAQSQQRIEAAKEGLGGFGQLLVDAGASTAQMAADWAASAALGGGLMLPLAVRSFGGAAQEARQGGGSLGQQIAYAVPSMAVEIFTERMSNIASPFKAAYGGGNLGIEEKVDEIIASAVKKFAKNGIGEKLLGGALKGSASFAFEGLEEFVGDWLSWQLPRIYKGDVNSFSDQLADSLRDFVTGGLSGLFGSAVDVGTYTYNADAEISRMVEERAQAAEYRNNISLGQNLKAAGITNEQVRSIIANVIGSGENEGYFDALSKRIAQGEDLSQMGDAELGALYSLYTAMSGNRISEEEYQDRVQKIEDSRKLEAMGYRGEKLAPAFDPEPAPDAPQLPTEAPAPESTPVIPTEILPPETPVQAAETSAEAPVMEAPETAENPGAVPGNPTSQTTDAETPENLTLPEMPETPALTENGENGTLAEEPAEQLPTPYRSENGYTVDKSENGSRVSFNSIPPKEVRDALKKAGFRYDGKKKAWDGKLAVDELRKLLDGMYPKSETPAGEAELAPQSEQSEAPTIPAVETQEQVEPALKLPTVEEPPAKQRPKSPVKPTSTEETATEETLTLPTEDTPQRKPHEALSDALLTKLKAGEAITREELQNLAADAYGGSRGSGNFDMKTAYDALELAVNRYLMAADFVKKGNGNAANAGMTEKRMLGILDLLPTQNVRTEEQVQYQQFSTPPNIAYLAAWAANIDKADTILEPSAGIGGLALWGKAWGATVYGNELSQRRAEILRSLGLDEVFTENAEQINNILPDYVSPSVVLMNPPFSSAAGRTSTNNTANAKRHVEQALERLQDGGRLVTILGRGMSNDSKTFAPWWDELRKDYNIRANLSINGENYKKYGTDFDVQLVVIDKTGPQEDRSTTITGQVDDLLTVPGILEGVRNDRQRVETDNNQPVRRDLQPGNQPRPDSVVGQSGAGRGGERAEGGGLTPSAGTGMERSGNGGRGNQPGRTRADELGVGDGGRGGVRREGGGDAGSDSGKRESERDDRPVPQLTLGGLSEAEEAPAKPKEDNGVYAEYVPPKTGIQGAKKHPAKLVESAAMASVPAPKVDYTPNLPKELITSGKLSDVQLTNIVYAGAAHSQMIPEQNTRKGYFIGDGTGVGKGRQIAGIVLDNFRQGREKAVWISNGYNLFPDAQRDWSAIGGDKKQVFSLDKTKLSDKIKAGKGIMFTTYSTLASKSPATKQSRINQLVEWLGEDFDGVIAFDEAHNMGNLLGKKGTFGGGAPSQMAIAGAELQKRLPNARVVYVSATMATDVDGMAFADRLGLWGPGTQFTNVRDFVDKIGSGGLAAMELVARDMKAMGVYQARSISFDGVQYETLTHSLTETQTQIYDTMSRAWQITFQNINDALRLTGANLNPNAKKAAKSAYYNAMQRFYRQIITSMSMPSVISDIRKRLDEGKSVVLQIVNTNEAAAKRAITEMEDSDSTLEDLDITPRETLIGYLMKSFPVQEYEIYEDDNGRKQSRSVVDSAGNPVLNKKSVAERDRLIEQINSMSVPQGPLDLLFDAFGVENVAEVTGRKQRVVPGRDKDGNLTKVLEKRNKNSSEADAQAFQDGKKHILVFSNAGGTGKSYHADLTANNQQQRVHYILQTDWNAPKVIQGLGRTNRSNQASAPIYVLVTTNASGQKRFVSTIARRLDQLGAITKGQRQTGSGVFSAKDNLESDLARSSLVNFYRYLLSGQLPGLDAADIIDSLGLSDSIKGKDGKGDLNMSVASSMETFLNRIMSLELDKQNAVFDAFNTIFEREYEKALEDGTLDMGMETVRADKVEVADEITVYTDPKTGAETKYVQAKAYTKTNPARTVEALKKRAKNFIGLYRKNDGTVIGVFSAADRTDESGAVTKQVKVLGPVSSGTWQQKTLEKQAAPIPESEWDDAWAAEVEKAPKYKEEVKHMLTGALLPVWNKLPASGNVKVQRLIADDGRQYLGRIIDPVNIDGVLKSLGATKGRTKKTYSPADVQKAVFQNGGKAILDNDRMTLTRRLVGGEQRIEISGDNLWAIRDRIPEIYTEIIQSKTRYFIPNGEKQLHTLEKLLKMNPVREVQEAKAASYSLVPVKKNLTAEDKAYLSAVNSGDLETARKMVEEAAKRSGFADAIPEQTLTYATRTGAPPKKTVRVYKVFTVAPDGSPTALFVSGTVKLPQGVWLEAQDTWHFTAKNGKEYVPSTQNPYTKGGKTGGMVEIPNDEVRAELIARGFLPENSKAKSVVALAYRPGWHAGDLPFFPQGGTKRAGSNYENVHRYNQVVFECELDADHDYTEYAQNQPKAYSKAGKLVPGWADLQEMPKNGYYRYSTNPLTQGGKNGEWYISGSLKINRALTQQECDDILAEYGRLPQEWEQGKMDLSDLGYTGPQNDAARKTLAPVTYDDEGRIIPLSQRFNPAIQDVRYSKGVRHLNGNELPPDPEAWTAERVGSREAKAMSLPDLVEKLRHEYKIPVNTGGLRAPDARAAYLTKPRSVRMKVTGDIADLSHELGHHLDNLYGISDGVTDEAMQEAISKLSDEFKAAYEDDELPGEAVSEFLRRYFLNSETAKIDYPTFYDEFFGFFGKSEKAKLAEIADEFNTYYALSDEQENFPIHNAEYKGTDFRSFSEKASDLNERFRTKFLDLTEPLRRVDKETGGKSHIYAINSGYANERARAALTGDLYDLHANPIGEGLQKILKGVDLNNEKEYSALGMWLVCKHGIEVLADGHRVFANDAWNNPVYMESTMAAIEAKYPKIDFEDISERLYAFQKNVMEAYGVGGGLYSQETVDGWNEKWQFYVPFYRWFNHNDKPGKWQKRGYVNQTGHVRRLVGSGRDFINPVDNIMESTVRLITTAVYNDVARHAFDEISRVEGLGYLAEKWPEPVKKTTMNVTAEKSDFLSGLMESGLVDQDTYDEIANILNNEIGDVLEQYSRGKVGGDTVTVMRNGKPETWKINDPDLLRALTNLTPSRRESILNAIGSVNRFITGNITGRNIIWAITSNSVRDLETASIIGGPKIIPKLISGIVENWANSFKGDSANPLFKEYMAMGGESASAFTADRQMQKKIRNELQHTKWHYLNPITYMSFVGDTVERGPRYAYYKICRTEYGMTPEEAFYAAGEITTNFHRKGLYGSELNALIPFSGASLQGMDRASRWIQAEEVTDPKKRKKTAKGRILAYLGASFAIAVLETLLNNLNDRKRKYYRYLSSFTKNSYFVIPLNGGKVLALPKARELMIPISFFERLIERAVLGNKDAFDGFWEYVTDNTLPGVISGIAQGDWNSVVGDLAIIGDIHYLVSNQDFLGRPIVSASLENLNPEDQYNNSTSVPAKIVGEAFKVSPQMVDYIGSNYFTFAWKPTKALWNVGGTPDYTLGVRSQWEKDPLYSTDFINNLYDARDKAKQDKNSNPGSPDKAMKWKLLDSMTTAYSRYYALAKAQPEDAQSRALRESVLDAVEGALNGENPDPAFRYVKDAVAAADSPGDVMPSAVAQTVKYAVSAADSPGDVKPSAVAQTVKDRSKTINLTASEYWNYQTDYNAKFYNYVRQAMKANHTPEEKVNVCKAAKDVASIMAKGAVIEAHGGTSDDYDELLDFIDGGGEVSDFIRYKAAKNAVDDDGYRVSEAIGVVAGLQLPDVYSQAYMLSQQSESLGQRFKQASGYGVDIDEFALVMDGWEDKQQEWKASGQDGKSGWTQKAAEEAIDAIYGKTTVQNRSEKAAAWQALNGQWSPKNNPYNQDVGNSIYSALQLPTE